jgi:hypothetical protein
MCFCCLESCCVTAQAANHNQAVIGTDIQEEQRLLLQFGREGQGTGGRETVAAAIPAWVWTSSATMRNECPPTLLGALIPQFLLYPGTLLCEQMMDNLCRITWDSLLP